MFLWYLANIVGNMLNLMCDLVTLHRLRIWNILLAELVPPAQCTDLCRMEAAARLFVYLSDGPLGMVQRIAVFAIGRLQDQLEWGENPPDCIRFHLSCLQYHRKRQL